MTCRRTTSMTVAERTPLVEMRDINVAFGGVHAVRDVTIDLYAGEVDRPRRWQRGRQVDPDARPVGRAPRRHGGDPDGRSARVDPQPARRQGLQHRDDLPDARPGRQRRCAGQPVPWPRAHDPLGNARRLGHGGCDPQGHGPPQPELHELRPAGQVAVRRPAAGSRDRPGRLLQRPDPDHGRADRGARPGRDGPGPQPRPAAEGGGDRHLPHQPRHSRRVRPVRPDQRHVPRPDRRHRQQGRRHPGRRPGHDHPGQEARRSQREGDASSSSCARRRCRPAAGRWNVGARAG